MIGWATIVELWYDSVGRVCAYCGGELTDFDEASEIHHRHQRKNRSKYTDEEVRLPLNFPTRDHVVAQAQGGTNAIKNLVVCCHQCNRRKQDKPLWPIEKMIRRKWFEAVDAYLIRHHANPQPDPY